MERSYRAESPGSDHRAVLGAPPASDDTKDFDWLNLRRWHVACVYTSRLPRVHYAAPPGLCGG